MYELSSVYTVLAISAESLEDLERTRIAMEGRLRSLREMGAVGLSEVAAIEQSLEVLRRLEHEQELVLKRVVRRLPFHAWLRGTVGVGEKQAARLLGLVGPPNWRFDNVAEAWHPRTVGNLWSYCGYAVRPNGVAPARRRGEQVNYNPDARMRAFLIAESCMKQSRSPYRVVYDDARAKYADAIHGVKCVRCGPSGKPAEVGSPLSAGHQHARALRLVAKAFLRDLWVAAREAERGAD